MLPDLSSGTSRSVLRPSILVRCRRSSAFFPFPFLSFPFLLFLSNLSREVNNLPRSVEVEVIRGKGKGRHRAIGGSN